MPRPDIEGIRSYVETHYPESDYPVVDYLRSLLDYVEELEKSAGTLSAECLELDQANNKLHQIAHHERTQKMAALERIAELEEELKGREAAHVPPQADTPECTGCDECGFGG